MSSRVYVGNLDFSLSDQFLREVFGRCDGFLSAQTIVNQSTGHRWDSDTLTFRAGGRL